MGAGTDVALETADAAVLHGRVSDLAAMVDLSKRTMVNIPQSIAVALALKAVFLVTTVVGLTGLWPAILADTGATVLVTINALRPLGSGAQPLQRRKVQLNSLTGEQDEWAGPAPRTTTDSRRKFPDAVVDH